MGAVRIPMALVWLLRKFRKNKENIKSNIIECTWVSKKNEEINKRSETMKEKNLWIQHMHPSKSYVRTTPCVWLPRNLEEKKNNAFFGNCFLKLFENGF